MAEDGTTRNYRVELRQPPVDAFVANNVQANRVWVNDGCGGFTDSGVGLRSSTSYGVAPGDVHWQ